MPLSDHQTWVPSFTAVSELVLRASDVAGMQRHKTMHWVLHSKTRIHKNCAPLSRVIDPGEAFGEVAFFTEVSQHDSVRSISVCRVLTIPRAAYHSVASHFPIGSRRVLENLLVKTQQASATTS